MLICSSEDDNEEDLENHKGNNEENKQRNGKKSMYFVDTWVWFHKAWAA